LKIFSILDTGMMNIYDKFRGNPSLLNNEKLHHTTLLMDSWMDNQKTIPLPPVGRQQIGDGFGTSLTTPMLFSYC